MELPQARKQFSETSPLRVVFLVGADNRSTRMSVEAVCQISGITPIAILLDTHRDPFSKRVKNLRANLRKEGWRYLPARLLEAFRRYSDQLVDRAVVSQTEVKSLLQRAFPGRCFTLEEVAAKNDSVPALSVRSTVRSRSPL